MKINWGTKLTFVAIAFMAFIITLVVIISKQDVPMVEDNYYEKGLNYQKNIDNDNNRDTSVHVNFISSIMSSGNTYPLLEFEKNSTGDILGAEVYFYRPSDPKMDRHISVDILSNTTVRYAIKDLKSGMWRVKVSWKNNNETYSIEKEFNL